MNFLKSLLLLVLFFSGTTILNAQDSQDSPAPASPKFSAGLSIGTAFSRVSSNQLVAPITNLDFNTLSTNTKWNEAIGLHLLYHINEEYGIESGVFYDKKIINLSGNNGGANQDKETNPVFTYEFLTFPLLFKKTIGSKKVKGSFLAGPYFSLLQSSAYTNRIYTITVDSNNNYIETAKEETQNLTNASREVNFGLLLKAGAEMKATEIITPFIFGFYSQSFSKADDFTDVRATYPDAVEGDGKFSSFGISLGIYFRMK